MYQQQKQTVTANQRHAETPEDRRDIQKQLRIENRGSIAIAVQEGAVQLHRELPALQGLLNALNPVELVIKIVSVQHIGEAERQ